MSALKLLIALSSRTMIPSSRIIFKLILDVCILNNCFLFHLQLSTSPTYKNHSKYESSICKFITQQSAVSSLDK